MISSREVRPGFVPATSSPSSACTSCGSRPTSSGAPAGGGASADSRDSTTSRASLTVSASTSRPFGLSPTEFTCTPGDSHSRRTTGSVACVVAATTSAPRIASSYELTARAFGPSSVGERFGFRRVAPCDANLVELPDALEGARVRPCLDSRADEGEHLRVLAREQPCRQRRARSRPGRGDVPPVHQRQRGAVLRIEDRDHRLMRVPVGVLREERHELAGEPCRGKVRRHHPEQTLALLHQRSNARRHRRVAGAQVSVCGRERVDELVEIEQLAHLGFGEEDHDRRFSRPSACWFQGTRCVTPAAPTRPRFARYQSYVSISASRFDSRGCQPEQLLRLRDVDEGILVRGLVVPLRERRDAHELEAAQRDLGGLHRNGLQPRRRARVVDQRLQVGTNGAELGRADVERLSCGLRLVPRAHDRIDEILDRRAAGSGCAPCRACRSDVPRGSSRRGSRTRPVVPGR